MSVTPGPTTGFTIGAAQFPTLTAQPFAYDETDTRAGLTARKWILQGLLKPSEWVALLGVYDGWRNTRITDPDTLVSGTVGTTIALSGKGAGSQTWTSIACWFAAAPSGEQVGSYIATTIELVDAAQVLDVLLREQEKSRQSSESTLPSFGSWFIVTGSPDKIVPSLAEGETAAATIVLKADPVTYQDGPQLGLTATGNHYIQGARTVTRVRRINGTTSSAGWAVIQTWYEEAAITAIVNRWFPISAPSATAETIISNGVKSTSYTVTFDLAQIK